MINTRFTNRIINLYFKLVVYYISEDFFFFMFDDISMRIYGHVKSPSIQMMVVIIKRIKKNELITKRAETNKTLEYSEFIFPFHFQTLHFIL